MCHRKFLLARKLQLSLLVLCLSTTTLQADTIVNVQSNLGNFKLELFEDKAPATVAQFLANIEAGLYQFTMVHEVTSTTMAAGQYFYNSCSEGPVSVPAAPAPSIPVEATGLSNIRRTIAMVPNTEDPSTVSSQWLINLGDNDQAFDPAAKPVVFGEVIEGLSTVDDIVDSSRVPMDVSLSVPTVNYDSFQIVQCGIFTRDNVIKVAMDVESVDPPVSTAANVFDEATGMLSIKVDAGTEGLLALSLMLQSTEPSIVLQAQPETVMALSDSVAGIATFDLGSGELTLPELVINGAVAFTNVVFRLTDTDNLFFTFVSSSSP